VKTFDLIVVGLGIIGAACAERAAAAGLKVAAVEAGEIGGGATAAAMGHLVALDEDPAELALAAYSQRLWQEFADLPQAQFNRCGTLWLARTAREHATIQPKLARLQAAGLPAQRVDSGDLQRLEPGLAPALAGGLLVPGDAVVYPPNIARELVARACRCHATLHLGRRVQALDDGGVQLDDGARLRGPTLVATGCALPDLLPALPLRRRKGHLVVTSPYPGALRHQVVELGYADSAHGTAESSVAFNVQPRPGGQLLIGSSREFGSDSSEVSMPMVARMLARAFEFMPGLARLQAVRIWTGFRPSSIDGRPYLGPIPDRRDLWVAAGHEGLGITTALASAHLLIDQLLQRTPAIDPRPFWPARALR
jgi:glycine/D-amino acid oxidase-like deaminating enzyme